MISDYQTLKEKILSRIIHDLDLPAFHARPIEKRKGEITDLTKSHLRHERMPLISQEQRRLFVDIYD